MGSVFIWHMYHPRSDSRTSRMWRYHVRCSLCVTPIRWFFVITWLWMVRIVCVSTRSHATYNNGQRHQFSSQFSVLSSLFAREIEMETDKCENGFIIFMSVLLLTAVEWTEINRTLFSYLHSFFDRSPMQASLLLLWHILSFIKVSNRKKIILNLLDLTSKLISQNKILPRIYNAIKYDLYTILK